MKITDRKLYSGSLLAIAISLAAMTFSVRPVASQELPPEGQFKITYTAVNPSPPKPVAISATKDILMNNLIMTASNDAGSGLLHGLAGRCAILNTIDKAAKTVESKGSCTYTDRSGDMVFEDVATTSPQPMGPVVALKGAWKGGTESMPGSQVTSTSEMKVY
jgi:hypothetical protein